MTSGESSRVGNLPPKPNVYTGLPRPPHAPLRDGWTPGDSDLDPARKPSQPPGQGPVLEWYLERRRGALDQGLICALIILVALSFFEGGLAWMSDWYAWLLVLWPIPFFYSLRRVQVFSAGAEWFSFRGVWVRTYELTEVQLKVSAVKWDLHLADSGGRRTQVPWQLLQANRELWDLVYNGIRHSAHGGKLKTNREARRIFRLPG